MISKDEALVLLKKHLKAENLLKHSLAVGLIMQGIAKKFGYDEDLFYICGLLHDIDLDYTADDDSQHGLKAMELLENVDITDDMLYAIRSHAGKETVKSFLDKALWASDPLSGLVIAAALMRPEKTIKSIPLKSLKKRFKDKRFAKGANREQIKTCTTFGIELDDFLQLAIDSMSTISILEAT